MKTINELQNELKQISNELDEIKHTITRVKEYPDVTDMKLIAQRFPIAGHPLKTADDHEKSVYLHILMSVLTYDTEYIKDAYALFYRIAYGMDYEYDTDDMILNVRSDKFSYIIDDSVRLFGKKNIKYILILECMLIASFYEKRSKKKVFDYISKLSIIMGLKKDKNTDDITMLCELSRAILTNDEREYKCEKEPDDIFRCYTDNIPKQYEFLYCNMAIDVDYRRNDYPAYLDSADLVNNKVVLTYNGNERTISAKFPIYVFLTESQFRETIDHARPSGYNEYLEECEKKVVYGIGFYSYLSYQKVCDEIKEYVDQHKITKPSNSGLGYGIFNILGR